MSDKFKICYRSNCPINDSKQNECQRFDAWVVCLRCIERKEVERK